MFANLLLDYEPP